MSTFLLGCGVGIVAANLVWFVVFRRFRIKVAREVESFERAYKELADFATEDQRRYKIAVTQQPTETQ